MATMAMHKAVSVVGQACGTLLLEPLLAQVEACHHQSSQLAAQLEQHKTACGQLEQQLEQSRRTIEEQQNRLRELQHKNRELEEAMKEQQSLIAVLQQSQIDLSDDEFGLNEF